MCNICVFAGTTEGRELVEFLAGQPVLATVCVATEYGETLLPEAENITVLAGRIPVEDIIRMLRRMRFDLVIDATHPYATSITESICTACRETETEYLRLLRQSSEQTEDVVCVENAAAAAAFLESTRGNILLTTGSKELAAYSGINDLCRTLTEGDLGHVSVYVGQRLGYPDECIVRGTAAELTDGVYAPLSVVLIENPHPDAVVTPGLPDDAFLRSAEGMPVVPMTKSEVRAVCLSKLRLTERSVCWDIGAGTGSVSVEMALQAKQGLVCAVERREDAAALLGQNRNRFALENLQVICGSAPEACAGLPAPTHAFIGGSAGNMHEIVALLLAKNPHVRIVATAVSLESVAELTDCLTAFPFAETEVVSLQAARDRKAGSYHLMSGQNPIYIFTMQGGGETA